MSVFSDSRRQKSHVECIISPVFDEPLCEVSGSRTLLGHLVLVIMESCMSSMCGSDMLLWR